MNLQQRLEIFLRRLEAVPPAANADEAMTLVCRLIEEVEDEFCPQPREDPPPALRFTGRMYAPRSDRMTRLPQGLLIANARRHRITCHPDGAIVIEQMPGSRIVLLKAGRKT